MEKDPFLKRLEKTDGANIIININHIVSVTEDKLTANVIYIHLINEEDIAVKENFENFAQDLPEDVFIY